MPTITLLIANDFSRYPAGRTRRDGENSGERFRDDYLVPALRRAIEQNSNLVVVLDDVYGYSSSFLEESFGGLLRTGKFRPELIERNLRIEARSPVYASAKLDAEKYLAEEIHRVPA